MKENEYILVGSGQDINQTFNVQPGWHLERLYQLSSPLDETFTADLTGENVDVYILDSGIHYEHEDFDGRADYPGCDPIDKLYNQNQAGRDCSGHGTHVAGLVGGNGTGVAIGVTLFSVRVLDCVGRGSTASLVSGFDCVINHTRSRNETRAIINISIAGPLNESMNIVLQNVLDNGIIIVASSGNNGLNVGFDSCKVYPAGYPGVITVGATDNFDNVLLGEFDGRIYTTNVGKCVDVVAPGYKILSSYICSSSENCFNECDTGSYNNTCRKFKSGTSQSAPLVTGAIALLLEECPELTNTQVKDILQHELSIARVKVNKVVNFVKKNNIYSISILNLVTNLRLLYIGNNLENITNCSSY